MTDFVFIRHGQTDWNLQLRIQGSIDVPLNATGRAQAQALAARLATEPAPDALYASDLQRARQTAEPLAQAWRLPLHTDARLREQHFGILEGMDAATVQAEHPALWDEWLQHQADFALPGGGESLRIFHDRVIAAVDAIAAAHGNGQVVVVTHGGVLDMLWRNAQSLSLDGRRECAIPNVGINWLRRRDGVLLIDHWGDDAHLRQAPV